jgi:hypothetical protein
LNIQPFDMAFFWASALASAATYPWTIGSIYHHDIDTKGLYDDLLFPCLSSHNTDTFVYFVCWQIEGMFSSPNVLCDSCVTRGVRVEWPRVCTEQIRPAGHLGKWRFLAQSTLTPVNGPPFLPLLYYNTQGFTGHTRQANNYIVPCDISRDQVLLSSQPLHRRLPASTTDSSPFRVVVPALQYGS